MHHSLDKLGIWKVWRQISYKRSAYFNWCKNTSISW